jgi:hypothetical protein
MCLVDNQNRSQCLMLQEFLEIDDFFKVSSAIRLVNISGTVRAIDLKFLQVKDMGLLHMQIGLWVYCSATTTMVAEIELNE